ncbi:MAG: hypothetical protein KJ072_23650 [Verrucomicrobia bacterium]|nr:hypothetical protein [Verrucomicrobiota bacterium]
MTYPFEAGFAAIQGDPEPFITAVFSSLESEFLVMPKGDGFIGYPMFEAGYETLKRISHGFTNLTPAVIIEHAMANPVCLSVADPLYSMLLLSSGVFDVTVIPGLSSTAMGGNQTRLVAFPTFSIDQLTALRNELGPSRVTCVHGVPPSPENQWRTTAIAQINGIDTSSLDNVFASTLDYRETLDRLLALYAAHSDRERILLFPTGSKMQSVAVGLFRAFMDDVQIVYPTPKEFCSPRNYTRGVGWLHSLVLDEFAQLE